MNPTQIPSIRRVCLRLSSFYPSCRHGRTYHSRKTVPEDDGHSGRSFLSNFWLIDGVQSRIQNKREAKKSDLSQPMIKTKLCDGPSAVLSVVMLWNTTVFSLGPCSVVVQKHKLDTLTPAPPSQTPASKPCSFPCWLWTLWYCTLCDDPWGFCIRAF